MAVEDLRAAWVMLMRTWSSGTFSGGETVLRESNSMASDPEVYVYARHGCYEDIEQTFRL